MQKVEKEASALTWEPPGPGQWYCEASHFPRPVSATIDLIWQRLSGGAMRAACARYGLPTDGFAFRTVHGWPYSTPISVDVDELDGRERAASAAVERRPWLDDARRWTDVDKPRWIERNLAAQDVEPARLDDGALADHLDLLLTNLLDGSALHFDLHLADMIPTGRLLLATRRRGIEDRVVLDALTGCSPASRHDDDLAQVAAIARDAAAAFGSLEDVVALGDAAAAGLERYLRHHGWRTVSRWDVDAPTLIEQPALTLAAIRHLAATETDAPSWPRPALDVEPALLDDAVATFGLRDDNVGILGSWPMGLLRRAMLETGSRLARTGALTTPALALEATPTELARWLRGRATVDAEELVTRHADRQAAWDVRPPIVLGDDRPGASAAGAGPVSTELLDALDAYGMLMDAPPGEPLVGTGVGDAGYIGRAVVAHSSEEALDELAPGDVLVAWATSPAFDQLLAIAGAVVTVSGGLLSHTAVAAREIGIPAVLGATDATTLLRTGDVIEVDPVAGRVTILG